MKKLQSFRPLISKLITKNFCNKRTMQYKLVKSSSDTYEIKENKQIDLSPRFYKSKGTVNSFTPSLNLKENSHYDVIIVGAGHNGLVCANYLAERGKRVLILEKRHTVGGCAVTEEIVEGYKFSRCSYVLSLFRKKIIDELFPSSFYNKVKLYKRNPKGLTPTTSLDSFLVRRSDRNDLKTEISKLSANDAAQIDAFDSFLTRMVKIVDPLIDMPPMNKISFFDPKFRSVCFHILKHSKDLVTFYHFLTSNAEYYLDKYFENDLLKGTFATDAVIGAMKSPRSTGSAYVLLHHVMGSLDDEGSWFYVEGGNGAVSEFLADEAVSRGAKILVNSPVENFVITNGKVEGVTVKRNSGVNNTSESIVLTADTFVVNSDLHSTYFKLMNQKDREALMTKEEEKSYDMIDYTSPVVKINLVIEKLPRFKCLENVYEEYKDDEKVGRDFLTGTIHMNSDSVEAIHNAYLEAMEGKDSTRPIVEMTIPSILDKTLVPKGSTHHVVGLFCQYAGKGQWTSERKRNFVNRIYDEIEKYAPGFKSSILFEDVLSPEDLEKEFSVKGGNIFHGAMDLSSVFFCRPFPGKSDYKQLQNLYSCSAAMHPGGGVMGAAGRNCAFRILDIDTWPKH